MYFSFLFFSFKMEIIRLTSSDNQEIEIDYAAAYCIGILQVMLNVVREPQDNEAIPLNVNVNVNGIVLTKVLDWVNHYKFSKALVDYVDDDEEDDEEKEEDMLNDIWDADFINVSPTMLCDLIKAADYLNIRGLLELTCKALACKTKGKTPHELRQTFNVKKDFTEPNAEDVRRENEWCV